MHDAANRSWALVGNGWIAGAAGLGLLAAACAASSPADTRRGGRDGGVRRDSGSSPDAGGGTDARAIDGAAAIDAGRVTDAGSTPACTIEVRPPTGDTTAMFTFVFMATGAPFTTCRFAVDGAMPTDFMCLAATSTIAGPFAEGMHTIAVTLEGPGGTATCADSWIVTPGPPPPPPTCTAVVMPETGTPSTTFTGTITLGGGTATMCGYSIDGAPPTAFPCASGSASATGLAVGAHRLDVTVAGPGGTTMCADTWDVMPDP